MRQYINAYTVANQARMRGNRRLGNSILLLEGSTDARLYGNFTDGKKCRILPADGKENALGALQILVQDGWQGVLAIVDADFGHLEKLKPVNRNVLFTDTHDLETMLLASPALEKVLREFKINLEKLSESFREEILEVAKLVGYLRWLSITKNFNLTFDVLDFDDFLVGESLTVDKAKLIKALQVASHRASVSWPNVPQQIIEIVDTSHDLWQVCCGHDVVSTMSVALRRKFDRNLEPHILEKNLRLAYELRYFSATILYRSIKEWESNNKPFTVLMD